MCGRQKSLRSRSRQRSAIGAIRVRIVPRERQGIIEYEFCCLKADAVIVPVGPVLFRVPDPPQARPLSSYILVATRPTCQGGSDEVEARWRGAEPRLEYFAGYPSNRLLFGKPLGGRRPASARLPIHSLSSGRATVKVRPAESRHVRPSASAKTFASDMPPSL